MTSERFQHVVTSLSKLILGHRKACPLWLFLHWMPFCCTAMPNVKLHTFNCPFSRTTWVSRYQKAKTNLDFTEARDIEWHWRQLGHMQVCIALQTDSHASTTTLVPTLEICRYLTLNHVLHLLYASTLQALCYHVQLNCVKCAEDSVLKLCCDPVFLCRCLYELVFCHVY